MAKSSTSHGWGDVGKEDKPSGRFLSVDEDSKVRLRILDDGPHNRFVYSVEQPNDEGESVYRSIPATTDLDDDWLMTVSDIYRRQRRHAIRVLVYDDDNNPAEVKILEGGKQIFTQLKDLYLENGDITSFDITLKREGKGIKTNWVVNMVKGNAKLDVAEWQEEVEADEALDWDNVYPEIDAATQRKMFLDAGFSEDYDPIGEAMETMTLKQAQATRCPFGEYGPNNYPPNGKKLKEVFKLDPGRVEWMAANVTSNFEFAAACKLLVQNADHIESGEAPKQVAKKSKPKPKAAKPKKVKKEAGNRKDPEALAELQQEKLDDLMEEWPVKLEPAKYIARWSKGKHVKLAKRIVALQKKIELLTADEVPEPDEYDEENVTAEEQDEIEEDEELDEDEIEDEDDEEEDEDEDDEEEDEDEDDDTDDLRDMLVDLIDERIDEPTMIVKLIKKHTKKRTTKLREMTSKEMSSMIRQIKKDF